MTFTPPLREIAFALTEIAGGKRLQQSYPGFDEETLAAVLDAGGKLARDVLAPLNRIGDETGARIENGRVRAVPGFAEAYRAFAEGGWNALAADSDHSGQGLPKALEIAVYEMVHSANMAFGLCPMLTQGAIEALSAHGTERQKNLYLPKLISGEWTGTMNLTEPQAGSDLAALRTRAEPDGNGGYRLTGQKIFITWGDHDMADNIVHLVLCRKLALGNGQAVRELIEDISRTCAEIERSGNEWLAPVAARLRDGIAAVRDTTGWLIERRGHAQPDALAGATAYLKLLGDVTGGWMLAKGALIAANHLADDGDKWWRTRIGLARLFAEGVLAGAPALAAAVMIGANDLAATSPQALGHSG